jgi:hypothetical protein
MAIIVRRKLLGSATLSGTNSTVYTVPDGFVAEIQTITAHNIDSSVRIFKIYLADDGVTFDNTTKIYEQSIGIAHTLIDTSTKYLNSGGVIQAAGNNILIRVYGIEYREI